MPRKKAVQSEAVVSSLSDLAPVKVNRKKTTVKTTDAPFAPVVNKATGTRKKAAVATDTPVAAVTHRHKKQDVAPMVDEALNTGAAVAAYEPSHEEVAKLAYSYYVARGYQPGDQSADWFRAVYELKQRHLASLLSDSR